MKIGRIGLGPSRRELRREKEEAAAKQPVREENHRQPVKPQVLKAHERPYRQVVLPPDDVLDRRRSLKRQLPKQKVLQSKAIQPMHQVELTLSGPSYDEHPQVRHSAIQDIDKKGRLYLAQTSPPILASQKGQMVRLTFLDRYFDVPGGRWLRVGYTTPILGLIKDHRLSDTLREDVVVVDGPRRLDRATERASFRLVPPDELELVLEIRPDGTRVGLLDISAGGARFHHHRTWHFAKGKVLPLSLISGPLVLKLDAKVVRAERIRDRWGIDQGVTCVQWEFTDPKVKQDLLRLLTEVYRYLLAQRSGIKDKGSA